MKRLSMYDLRHCRVFFILKNDVAMSFWEIEMEKITCMSALTLLVLKEVRLEKGTQSAYIAEQIGKTPSAWAKVETGKSAFSMDSLFLVSKALWVPASGVINAVERYATLLGQHGWGVLQATVPAEEDSLLLDAQTYYGSPGFKRRLSPQFGFLGFNGFGISVLNSPINNPDGSLHISPVFQFALDSKFREIQLSEVSLGIPAVRA